MKTAKILCFLLLVVFSSISNAQLTFPTTLRNEIDGSLIEPANPTKRAVVVIHGWNPYEDDNAYDSGDFAFLFDQLKSQLQPRGVKLIG